MAREIPAGSVLIQEGLYLYTYTKNVVGLGQRTYGELYSAEGWCFYWISNPENYYEDETMKPLNERIFAQYSSVGLNPNVEVINSDYVSVPVQDGYEILSSTNHSTI